MPKITFLGHAAISIEHDGRTVLVDPFLTGNPKAAATADEVAADAIFVSHAHGDHVGDTVAIAKRTGATVVAIVELADALGREGVENVFDPNIGGTVDLDWVSVRLTPAWHTGTSNDGGVTATPAGLVIEIGGKSAADVSKELSKALPGNALGRDLSDDFRFAAGAASFGMILMDSQYRGAMTLAGVIEETQNCLGKDAGGHRKEFLDLVKKATKLSAPQSTGTVGARN